MSLTPPFTVETLSECFKIVDAEGVAVAYCYFQTSALIGTSEKMDRETARKMAAQIARLPDLLGRSPTGR